MWIVEITNSKGTRYKYRERFMDPATGRYTIVSVTLNSNSRQAQRAAADMLRDKIREKTKTAAERKAEKLAVLTFYDVLDEWRAYVAPTVKTRTADNHRNYIKRIKKVFTAQKFDLLERAAEAVADAILEHYDPIDRVIVKVSKPEAPISAEFGDVGVCITRER